ncbi:hypothetical protein D3C85_630810 [compost metagenome]
MIYFRVLIVWLSCMCGFLFNSRYSKEWDRKLNQLLDEFEIKPAGSYCVDIGGYVVWTANRYYAYATPYAGGFPDRRPSIKTMIRLNDMVEKSLFK